MKAMKAMKAMKGFTLIELMIVIAVIGILVAVALPRYQQYTRSAVFVEAKAAAGAVANQLTLCYELNGGPGPSAECNAVASGAPLVRGQVNSIALARAANGSQIASVTLTPGPVPVVSVIPTAQNGILTADHYILIGVLNASSTSITRWDESGQACERGYC